MAAVFKGSVHGVCEPLHCNNPRETEGFYMLQHLTRALQRGDERLRFGLLCNSAD